MSTCFQENSTGECSAPSVQDALALLIDPEPALAPRGLILAVLSQRVLVLAALAGERLGLLLGLGAHRCASQALVRGV